MPTFHSSELSNRSHPYCLTFSVLKSSVSDASFPLWRVLHHRARARWWRNAQVFVARITISDGRWSSRFCRRVGGERSAERFRREILTVARLQHPHIVPILKAGELDGVPYFVMPYVDGESVDVTLRRRKTLGVRETRHLKDVARALAFAHERNVVHRDIKPGNILFLPDPPQSRISE